MKYPKNAKLTATARALRKNMTPQEKRLWYNYLRDYPIRFRRQEIIGNFIADFYCDKAKLVIEIDGSQHFEEKQLNYDQQRTAFFQQYDLHVLRLTNHEINTMFQAVCDFIDLTVHQYYSFDEQQKAPL